MSQPTTHRQIVYRLLPGTPGRAQQLAALAGACRFVWNTILADQEALHIAATLNGGRAPRPTFFTLSSAVAG